MNCQIGKHKFHAIFMRGGQPLPNEPLERAVRKSYLRKSDKEPNVPIVTNFIETGK